MTSDPHHDAPDDRPRSDQVIAASRGDRVAFAALYRYYAPMVHAVLLTRVTRADADDLTQEVFVKAMDAISQLNTPDAIGPWLCAAARNRAIDFLRSERTQLAARQHAHLPHTAPPAPVGTDDVLAAMRALPDSAAEVLAMRLVAGLSGPQIAARTGQSHGAVRVALHRGMEQLRDALAKRGNTP